MTYEISNSTLTNRFGYAVGTYDGGPSSAIKAFMDAEHRAINATLKGLDAVGMCLTSVTNDTFKIKYTARSADFKEHCLTVEYYITEIPENDEGNGGE